MKTGLYLAAISSLLSCFGTVYADDNVRPIRPIPPIHPIPIAPREIPCSDALKTYFNWASGVTPAPEDNRGVVFSLVYNQQRNPIRDGIDTKGNVSGYSIGGLRYQGGSLVGDVSSYFSDRMFCPENTGGICLPSAPFNPKATDVAGITLTPDGKMTTVLKSWGNSAYTDQLVCLDNGIMYAPSKAGQKSMSVITLQKTGFKTPR